MGCSAANRLPLGGFPFPFAVYASQALSFWGIGRKLAGAFQVETSCGHRLLERKELCQSTIFSPDGAAIACLPLGVFFLMESRSAVGRFLLKGQSTKRNTGLGVVGWWLVPRRPKK
jgi:hypothetical protein